MAAHNRLDLRQILLGLMVATVGAALLWPGLLECHLGAPVESPFYVLATLILGAWVPMVGAGINAAWAADINAALAWACTWHYRERYTDGAVDILTMDDR